MHVTGARAFKSIVTGVDQQISSYTDALKALLEELDNTANLNTAVIVYRVLDDLNEMSQQFDKIGKWPNTSRNDNAYPDSAFFDRGARYSQ